MRYVRRCRFVRGLLQGTEWLGDGCEADSGHGRNVRSRLGGALDPFPVRVPALQLEPGKLHHQVKFRRPYIAVRATGELGQLAAPRCRLALTEPEMARDG